LSDLNPQLVIASSGDRRVVWWQDGSPDLVYQSHKSASDVIWSAPVLVSDGLEDARFPRLAVFGNDSFVAYESVPPTGNRKVIIGKQFDPGGQGGGCRTIL